MAVVDLSWDAVTRRTDGSTALNVEYRLERHSGDGAFAALQAGLTGATHADTVPDPAVGTGVVYTYRLRSEESGYTNSAWVEATVTVGTISAVPGKPTVSGVATETSITATGTAGSSGGAPTQWRFRHKLTSASTWNSWTDYSSSNTAVFSSLTANTSYDIQAQAKNAIGESPVSDVVAVSTMAQVAPTAPTLSLTATQTTVSATVGRGTGGGDPATYLVEISPANTFLPADTSSTTLNAAGSTTFTGLNANTTYYVRATATNPTGTSPATTRNITTPNLPATSFSMQSSAQVTVGGTVAVNVSSVTPTGASMTIVNTRTPTPSNPADVTASITDNSGGSRTITFTGVSAGPETFRVTVSASGRTDSSGTITVTASTAPVARAGVPTLAAVSGSDCESVEVTATATAGGTPIGYQFEIRTGNSGTFDTQTGWGNNTHDFEDLDTDTGYSVRARARSGTASSQTSAWSSWRSVSTCDPCDDSSLSISAGSGSLTFNAGDSPADIPLTITSEGVTPNAPQATSSDSKVSATIITTGVFNPTYSVRIRSTTTDFTSNVSATITVSVDENGDCDLDDDATISVTLRPPVDPCAGVSAPTGGSIVGTSSLVDGGSDGSITAEATLGTGANGMKIEAVSLDTSVCTVANDGGVGTGPLSTRNRDFTISPAGVGTTSIQVTFTSTKDGSDCSTLVRTHAVTVAVAVDPCADADVTVTPGSQSADFEWPKSGTAPGSQDFYVTIALGTGAVAGAHSVAVSNSTYLTAAITTSTMPNLGTHRVRLTPKGTPPRGSELTTSVTITARATCTNGGVTNNYSDTATISVDIDGPPELVGPGLVLSTNAIGLQVGQTGTFRATGSDEDGTVQSISASSSATGVATVNEPSLTDVPLQTGQKFKDYTVTAVAVGSATITVTVTDDDGETTTGTVAITVTAVPNRPPRSTGTAIPSTALALGATDTKTLSDYFEDPDGDPLTYEILTSGLTSTGNWGTPSISNGVLSVTAPSSGVGALALNFDVRASDPDGLTFARNFSYSAQGTGTPGNGNGV